MQLSQRLVSLLLSPLSLSLFNSPSSIWATHCVSVLASLSTTLSHKSSVSWLFELQNASSKEEKNHRVAGRRQLEPRAEPFNWSIERCDRLSPFAHTIQRPQSGCRKCGSKLKGSYLQRQLIPTAAAFEFCPPLKLLPLSQPNSTNQLRLNQPN